MASNDIDTLAQDISDLHLQAQDAPILSSADLVGIAKYIKEHNCKNIITLVGAGISTSAGIPDFRTPGTGLYDNLQKYDLPHPQAIFSLAFFEDNPEPFFALAKELYPGNFQPTPCHHFIRLLQDKGVLLRHYTQNIDMLERMAGVDDDILIETHGSFVDASCIRCEHKYESDWIKEQIMADVIPRCTSGCQEGLVKPSIVFFGECLPSKFHTNVQKDFDNCDLLIVMGTSLQVAPVSQLINYCSPSVPRLLLNMEEAGDGFDFTGGNRDVFHQGKCDESVLLLAEHLEWKEDFDKLLSKGSTQETQADTKNEAEDAAEEPVTQTQGESGDEAIDKEAE